jgi:hypothetical protein
MLDRILAANQAKPSRERLTLIRLFGALRGLGYAGGYDAVRRSARSWRRERAATTPDAFVPQSFTRGHDNVLVERLWRSMKYEEVYLRFYDSVIDARVSLGSGWQHEEDALAVPLLRSGYARPR